MKTIGITTKTHRFEIGVPDNLLNGIPDAEKVINGFASIEAWAENWGYTIQSKEECRTEEPEIIFSERLTQAEYKAVSALLSSLREFENTNT